MTNVSLYIGIPCYGGQMHAGCTNSLLNLVQLCLKNQIDYTFELIYNQSMITIARNTIASHFMQSQFTHLLFIDADIQFDAQDIIQMIHADKDIIGGIYSTKYIDWDKIVKCVKDNKPVDSLKYNTSDIAAYFFDGIDQESININEPFQVKYIATGMMLIKKHVLQKMKESYAIRTYNYHNEEHDAYFDCDIKDNMYMTEDYYFCDRWSQLGGKIYAALWTKTIHYGNTAYYTDILKKCAL
jgi:hypothetical protein